MFDMRSDVHQNMITPSVRLSTSIHIAPELFSQFTFLREAASERLKPTLVEVTVVPCTEFVCFSTQVFQINTSVGIQDRAAHVNGSARSVGIYTGDVAKSCATLQDRHRSRQIGGGRDFVFD